MDKIAYSAVHTKLRAGGKRNYDVINVLAAWFERGPRATHMLT